MSLLERFEVELDDCGCCAGADAASPRRIENRPGLDAVAYRVGSWATFKESLLAALSASRQPALAALKTRDDDDFSIALVDAFACMADVLTFYQERLANEAFLRTADERLSLRELARLIGYRLAPGVAADALLAFTLEEAPGAPADAVGRTTVAAGTKVQSTPGPDEQPQLYETVEEIEGRVAWNAIRPPRRRRHPLGAATNPLYFEGLATRLRPGDAVLFPTDAGGVAFGVVAEVTPLPKLELTAVRLTYVPTRLHGTTPAVQEPDPVLDPPAANYLGQTWTAADLAAEGEVEGFDVDALLAAFADNPRPAPRAVVFRTRAAVFGHNAPEWKALPLPLKVQEKKFTINNAGNVVLDPPLIAAPFPQADWIDGKTLADLDGNDPGRVFLDAVYAGIGEGGTVVLRQGDDWAVYTVDAVADVSHAGFNLSAKVTRLHLDSGSAFGDFEARRTTVYAESEALPLGRLPRSEVFATDGEGWVELDGWVPGLRAGQRVIVGGRAVGAGAEPVSEAAVLAEIEHRLAFEGGARVQLAPPLQQAYRRDEVSLNANVAAATHGESVEEVLGSGDARRPYQSFTLAQPPLTFVGAATPSGRASTLRVRVNDVLWHEADSFYRRGPEERIYVTRQDEEGRTVVQFGDGVTGARLPTGSHNVRAAYRKGIGLAGRVGAGQLDVLMSRPLGLKAAVNPLPAEGGEDAEGRDAARDNAPLTVMTLDRAVSLQDYEDYARTFAGIAKALATWTWDGLRRSVFLTVAAAGGAEVPEGSFLHRTLLESLTAAGDPNVPLTVASYRKALFRLAADVVVHPDHDKAKVLAAVETALRAAFSFAAREFGQPVALSEVVTAIQGVEGVVAVDLNQLHRSDRAVTRALRLPAARPLAGERGEVEAAELLFLDPAPLADLRGVS